ncbi:hypothetical protein H5410_034447 [Solanum commersonii]|uniref:Uncharacterized protein n=1 Tax=Solanum commersonii TaxID=4109 RepID=A0A9J5YTB3_SOLCO|nr:hypothetical protein H5410_034447 [Solanum commersonii]
MRITKGKLNPKLRKAGDKIINRKMIHKIDYLSKSYGSDHGQTAEEKNGRLKSRRRHTCSYLRNNPDISKPLRKGEECG